MTQLHASSCRNTPPFGGLLCKPGRRLIIVSFASIRPSICIDHYTTAFFTASLTKVSNSSESFSPSIRCIHQHTYVLFSAAQSHTTCSETPHWSFASIMQFISLAIHRSVFLSFHSTDCEIMRNRFQRHWSGELLLHPLPALPFHIATRRHSRCTASQRPHQARQYRQRGKPPFPREARKACKPGAPTAPTSTPATFR